MMDSSSLKRKSEGQTSSPDQKVAKNAFATLFANARSNPKAAPIASSSISASLSGGLTSKTPLKPLSTIAFNKIEFLAGLSNTTADPTNDLATERELLRLEVTTLGESWLKVLHPQLTKPYFIKLKRFLEAEKKAKQTVFPLDKDIYSWSRYTPLDKVKVVIIGQDPYHGPGQAHGLAFSVREGVPVPKSLGNIYTELTKEYPKAGGVGDLAGFERPKSGSLVGWAKQGVLLLNTSLTVRANAAGSHANKGWEDFTDAVIRAVNDYGGSSLNAPLNDAGQQDEISQRGVVFLAWGAWAQKRVATLDHKRHLILQSAHPSPLSVHRGFFGCGHFQKANEWLKERYGPETTIDWTKTQTEPL